MTTKRMGGMGKLSDFGRTTPAEPTPPTEPKKRSKKSAPKEERLVTVNIKVAESQQEWLANIAKKVRRNNDAPVAAIDRVYPQHLIGIAIDLLKASDLDWEKVQNIQDLREVLNI